MKLAWSNVARAELAEIRRYSTDPWGANTAIRYMRDLRNAAGAAAAEGARVRLLRGPWRIIRARSHFLICHRDERADTLTVARVLHAAMDIERHLPPGARPADVV